MASRLVVHAGVASSVYDDRWRPILESLGALQVQRASEVEFDSASGEWIAIERASGRLIARGRVRSEVIKGEVAYLEGQL